MARNKELLVLVLDVGPHMHACLEEVGQTLFNVVLAKMLNKPNHEVSVVLFGSTETKNVIHEEFAAEGDNQQFLNVYTAHILQCTDLTFLRTLSNLPRGYGESDFVNGLFVALDVLLKAVEERMMTKCKKQIVMISNFLGVPQPLDEVMREAAVEKLQANAVELEFFNLLLPPESSPAKRDNLNMIHNLVAETKGSVKDVAAGELATYFKAKEVAPFTMYRGPLSIGPNLSIQVRVCKKASRENLPTLKSYSDRSAEPGSTHTVVRDTEYKAPSNPEVPLPPEERIKAYRYGKQNVPLAKEDEEFLEYRPDKSFQVVGFVNASQVPRHQYTKEPSIVLPDLADPGSCLAISALAQALQKQNKVCIARPVLRVKDSAKLVALSPLLHTTSPFRPDCLVMNTLPFVEDIRSFFFPSLAANPDHKPSEVQMAAAVHLVKEMDLCPHSRTELLRPENTINPAINRFYTVLGLKALNPDTPVPEPDGLCDLVLEPPLKKMKNAEGVLEVLTQMKGLFHLEPVGMKAGAGKEGAEGQEAAPRTRFAEHAQAQLAANNDESAEPVVEHVSSSTPMEDFRAMLRAGQHDVAIQEMGAIIVEMVRESVGERAYSKAAGCVHALRTGCLDVERPKDFNDFLQDLCYKFKTHSMHHSFWARLMAANVSLISTTECASSTVLPEEAQGFVQLHSVQAKQEPKTPAGEEEEEDEFAGLE